MGVDDEDATAPDFDCWACYNRYCDTHYGWAFWNPPVMWICPECGDKNCRKAIDHHAACDHASAARQRFDRE
jgi:hypothetical protein